MGINAKKGLVAGALLFVLSLTAYSNTFNSDFHYDDYHQIVKNWNVRSLGNVPYFFTDEGRGSYHAESRGYRPITYSSFAVSYALSGYRAFGYHLFNFVLHFMNAFLVYLVVMAVFRGAGRGDDGYWPALLASLAFALHPIQTEAVTYISGRSALLATFFYLLAFMSFLRFRREGPKGGAGGYLWVFMATAFFVLALLSKEMAVSLLGVAIVYDLVFTYPRTGGQSRPLRHAACYVPLVLALAAYLITRKALGGFVTAPTLPMGRLEYLLSEAGAFLLYLRLMVLPVNQNLDHDLAVTSSPGAVVALAVVLAVLLLAALFAYRRKNPVAAFFGFWFFIALAPESSLVPITDITAEYRLYLPSAGFIAALVVFARDFVRPKALRKGLAACVLALLCILAFNRNLVWATEYTLWSDVARKSPYSARAHLNLGTALEYFYRRYPEALDELKRALELERDVQRSSNIYTELGRCLVRTGKYEDAYRAFGQAVKANPSNVEAYAEMGDAFVRTGRYADAVVALEEAIRINPGFDLPHHVLAKAYSGQGRNKEAMDEIEAALTYAPGNFAIRYDAALIYGDNGMLDKALEQAGAAASLAGNEWQRGAAASLVTRLQGGGQK